ncbi:hypothetical protein [Actinophytocola sp.]|jgi:hypothetical protein|uniref:hypothetical protein n=1 Tax=Actinophytocola sp. TaxID=1872138 RepID=UPI002D2EA4F1|nr:hypothetical protein [Actinophytocola sp.]HYQ62614.1 hypothetical protein [Actinophytocola sp.]
MDTLSRVGSWAVTNLLLGYALAFPVTSAVAFSYYVRAKVWGTVASPYGGAEAQISIAFVLVGGGVLVALAVLMNRRYRRTMRWPAFMYWLATVVLLVAPSLLFVLNESTVPQMLGKGLLW